MPRLAGWPVAESLIGTRGPAMLPLDVERFAAIDRTGAREALALDEKGGQFVNG